MISMFWITCVTNILPSCWNYHIIIFIFYAISLLQFTSEIQITPTPLRSHRDPRWFIAQHYKTSQSQAPLDGQPQGPYHQQFVIVLTSSFSISFKPKVHKFRCQPSNKSLFHLPKALQQYTPAIITPQ